MEQVEIVNTKTSSLSTSKSLILNTIFYAIMQIALIATGIILPKLFLSKFGSEVNGVVSTLNSFISYFNYLEAGLGLALMYSLFKPLVEKKYDRVNQIVTCSKHSYWRIGTIYIGLVIALSIIFPLVSAKTVLEPWEFVGLVFIIGLYGALDFITLSKYRILLTADRREYIISLSTTIALLVRFFTVLLLLNIPGISITVIKVVPVLTLFIRSIILKIYVKRKYPNVKYNVEYDKNSMEISKRWDAMFLQICISTNISFSTIIVSQIVGYKEASVFAVYNMILNVVIALSQMFNQGVSPIFGKIIAGNGGIRRANKLYEDFEIFIITIFIATTYVMLVPFIKIYTQNISDINYVNNTLALLFCVWTMTFIYRRSSTALINSSGEYAALRIQNIINIVLFLILSILFVILWGTNGVLIALIIVALHRDIYLIYYTRKLVLKESPAKAYINMLSMYILFTLCVLPFIFIFKIDPKTWFSWIGNAVLVFGFCFAVCTIFMLIFKRDTIKFIYTWIKLKLKLVLHKKQ